MSDRNTGEKSSVFFVHKNELRSELINRKRGSNMKKAQFYVAHTWTDFRLTWGKIFQKDGHWFSVRENKPDNDLYLKGKKRWIVSDLPCILRCPTVADALSAAAMRNITVGNGTLFHVALDTSLYRT